MIKNKIKKILNKFFLKGFIRKKVDFIEIAINKALCGEYNGTITNGWSFVIITNGKSNDTLNKTVESINTEMTGKKIEIIIVGPKNIPDIVQNNLKNIRYIKYLGIKFYPALITLKKNIGAVNSKFDKIVILHDYILFEKGWFKGYEKFIEQNGKFNVCMNVINFKDGRRSRDWVVLDYPKVGPALIPYESNLTEYQYISGTYFVVDRDFYLKNPLKENLRWNESEDIEWSKRIRNNIRFSFNKDSVVSFLRDKPLNVPPYCDDWILNKQKIKKILEEERKNEKKINKNI